MGRAFLSALRELPWVLNHFRRDIETIAGPKLASRLAILEKYIPHPIQSVCTSKLGKLSVFGDKEGKTRIVAITDYWTQTSLKPIHDHLMRLLRGIKVDCTFNQDNYKHLLSLPGPFSSFDLSSATDRMPL